jgi:hypothetical protein
LQEVLSGTLLRFAVWIKLYVHFSTSELSTSLFWYMLKFSLLLSFPLCSSYVCFWFKNMNLNFIYYPMVPDLCHVYIMILFIGCVPLIVTVKARYNVYEWICIIHCVHKCQMCFPSTEFLQLWVHFVMQFVC